MHAHMCLGVFERQNGRTWQRAHHKLLEEASRRAGVHHNVRSNLGLPLGRVEVGEDGAAVRTEEDVVRLDVAV